MGTVPTATDFDHTGLWSKSEARREGDATAVASPYLAFAGLMFACLCFFAAVAPSLTLAVVGAVDLTATRSTEFGCTADTQRIDNPIPQASTAGGEHQPPTNRAREKATLNVRPAEAGLGAAGIAYLAKRWLSRGRGAADGTVEA